MGIPRGDRFLDWASLINLGAMIEHGETILVTCTGCKGTRYLETADLVALAEKVGRDFSLKNRRTRCRLTSDCLGWNWFHYKRGVFLPFRDDRAAARWMLER